MEKEKKISILKRLLAIAGVAAFWIGLWTIAAYRVNAELILPSPQATVSRLAELLTDRQSYIIAGMSLLRVFAGTVSAMSAGIVFAAAASGFVIIEHLISPLVTIVRATPVVSFIILAFLWLGNALLPGFISFLMVFPIVYTNVKTGITETPAEYLKMADVFGLGKFTRIKRIYIPSALPYFSSAARSSFGLAWKAGVAAEVLVCTQNSIGLEIYNSKTYLQTVDLFAWTSVIIILSLIIELVFLKLTLHIDKKRKSRLENDSNQGSYKKIR